MKVPSIVELVEACPPDFPDEDLPALEAGTSAEDFEPLPYQHRFLNMESRRSAMICGLGTGKTQCGAVRAFHVSVVANPEPHVGIVAAPTFPMLRDVAIPKIAEVFPPQVWKGGSFMSAFHQQAKVATMRNGTQILFRALDGPVGQRTRGVQAAWAWGDEIGLLKSSDPWDVLMGRIRFKARYRAAWGTMTPKGMNWAADKWILNPADGYEYVHATIYDNPYLPRDYIRDLENSYSDAFRRQELMGELVSMQGAVYPDLSEKLWPDGNLLVYEPDPHLPVVLEIDFGFRHPAVQAIQKVHALDREGKSHTLDVVVWELQGRGGKPAADMKVNEWLDVIKRTGMRIGMAYGDPAGDSHNDQTHITSAQLVHRTLGCDFQKPTKSWQRSKERGEEVVRSRIKSADGSRYLVWAASPQTDRLGNHVPLAPNSFRAFRNLQYPEPKPGQAVTNESLKDGVNDHPTDAGRYRMMMEYGRGKVLRPWEVLSGMR